VKLIVNDAVEATAIAREIEMISSPAFRALSKAAHQVLARIEIGIADRRCRATYEDFRGFGVHRDVITHALRELEALGIVDVLRDPPRANRYTMSRRWRSIRTFEDALEIRMHARAFGRFEKAKRERRAARAARERAADDPSSEVERHDE
jgi:DNA-binding transcriptional ArsR family regulator